MRTGASVTTWFSKLTGCTGRRALENNKITTLSQLAEFTQAVVLKWHGIGKSSLPKLREALAQEGLTFKEDQVKANINVE